MRFVAFLVCYREQLLVRDRGVDTQRAIVVRRSTLYVFCAFVVGGALSRVLIFHPILFGFFRPIRVRPGGAVAGFGRRMESIEMVRKRDAFREIECAGAAISMCVRVRVEEVLRPRFIAAEEDLACAAVRMLFLLMTLQVLAARPDQVAQRAVNVWVVLVVMADVRFFSIQPGTATGLLADVMIIPLMFFPSDLGLELLLAMRAPALPRFQARWFVVYLVFLSHDCLVAWLE